MVTVIFASWNHAAHWLRRIDAHPVTAVWARIYATRAKESIKQEPIFASWSQIHECVRRLDYVPTWGPNSSV
jgi:hypothetical protein